MDEEGTYAPQSPDLSAFQTAIPSQQPGNSYYLSPQQQHQYQTATRSPSAVYHPSSYKAQGHSSSYDARPAPRNGQSSGRSKNADAEWIPDLSSGGSGRRIKKQKVDPACEKSAPGVEDGIEVKTKFPVARIKRIMQADEDVGKVAQVTPTAVSKALELFMISLVTRAAKEAKAKSSKRVTAAHLKQACERDEQWDFLASIMEKVPDAVQAKKDDDSDDAGDGRKKVGSRRRKRDS